MAALAGAPDLDLTVELIPHRFTPGSKAVLNGWYPGSPMERDGAIRAKKTTWFGSLKRFLPVRPHERAARLVRTDRGRSFSPAPVLYWI